MYTRLSHGGEKRQRETDLGEEDLTNPRFVSTRHLQHTCRTSAEQGTESAARFPLSVPVSVSFSSSPSPSPSLPLFLSALVLLLSPSILLPQVEVVYIFCPPFQFFLLSPCVSSSSSCCGGRRRSPIGDTQVPIALRPPPIFRCVDAYAARTRSSPVLPVPLVPIESVHTPASRVAPSLFVSSTSSCPCR